MGEKIGTTVPNGTRQVGGQSEGIGMETTVKTRLVRGLGLVAGKTSSATVTDLQQVIAFAKDDFARMVAQRSGTAYAGGAWSSFSGLASGCSAALGVGRLSLNPARFQAVFVKPAQHRQGIAAILRTDKAATGKSQLVSAIGRRIGRTADCAVVLCLGAGGSVWLVGSQEGESILNGVQVPGSTILAADRTRVRLPMSSTGPKNIRMKIWKDGMATSVGWTVTGVDGVAPRQMLRTLGLYLYLSSNVTNGPGFSRLDELPAGTV